MDAQLVSFIAALRQAGVRVSLAEGEDAARALSQLPILEREPFLFALRASLSKTRHDQAVFDQLFPLYFWGEGQPFQKPAEDLSEDEKNQLRQGLEQLAAMGFEVRESLQRKWAALLAQLMAGEAFSPAQLREMSERIGLHRAEDFRQRSWFARRLERQAGLSRLAPLLQQLRQALEDQGMDPLTIERIMDQLDENAAGLVEQLSRYVGWRLSDQAKTRPSQPEAEILDQPFWRLREEEEEHIRETMRLLVARIRTRASLRQKRARKGQPDPRKTLRVNLRYGGVPFQLVRRRRQLQPSLVLLCDVSTSVRHCAEYLLTMIYELQDQVRRTRSYVYIHDLHDISEALKAAPAQQALAQVLAENRPGYYSTDLGNGLQRFEREHMRWLDARTTLIFLGDGRNNYNDPNLAVIREMHQKVRRLYWFVPESRQQWGSGDSDIGRYARHADGVFPVLTLRQMAQAVDRIWIDGYGAKE